MNRSRILAFLILPALFLFSGCIQSADDSGQGKIEIGKAEVPSINEAAEAQPEAHGAFTMEEIASHSTAEDCWLLIGGKVYDVTDFVAAHPGGQAILEGCGTDATLLYETRPMGSGTPHSEKARQRLEEYYIGDLG